ncbi:hypothetical protein [Streptomyces sp. NPDC056638]|uniref:hypothetical protein n=1 Tax=unclassified Streptomyces TaxID=2593676 RepID=UPI0036C4B346
MTTPDRPDWIKMTPADFKAKTVAHQDALFITDQDDPYGTPTLEGFSGHIVHPQREK